MNCCKNCQNRKVTKDYNCHDHCKIYADRQKENADRNEAIRNNNFGGIRGRHISKINKVSAKLNY